MEKLIKRLLSIKIFLSPSIYGLINRENQYYVAQNQNIFFF